MPANLQMIEVGITITSDGPAAVLGCCDKWRKTRHYGVAAGRRLVTGVALKVLCGVMPSVVGRFA